MKPNSLEITNPTLSLEWHPELNGDLVPSIVTHGSVKKVWWVCSLDHVWQARVDHRHRGTGCPYCLGRLILPNFNSFAAINPQLLPEWDYGMNQSIDPTLISPSFNEKVWWKCTKHQHTWKATPKARNEGYGCHVCNAIIIQKGFNDLTTTHPDLIKEWDFSLNRDLADPENISFGSHRKAHWICATCQHQWKTSILHRSSGKGCPNCSAGKTERKFVQEICLQTGHKFISSLVPASRRLFKRDRIQVDGLCEELKIAFEYDGEWTHGANNPQKKSYQKRLDEDADTTEALLNAGYRVIRVREAPLDFVVIDHEKLDNEKLSNYLVQFSYQGNMDEIPLLVKDILSGTN